MLHERASGRSFGEDRVITEAAKRQLAAAGPLTSPKTLKDVEVIRGHEVVRLSLCTKPNTAIH